MVCGMQGLYFAATGVWPLVHLRSFELITGAKCDHWLVQTVGALIAIIGCVMLLAAIRGRVSLEIALLAVGSAFALGAVDVVFVATRVIPPIYLLDALVEAGLLVIWSVAAFRRRVDTALNGPASGR